MDETTLQTAKQYHARRDRQRSVEREQQRLARLQQVKKAILALAPRYPAVQRVYLYGSLVQPGRYGPHSDVDVAVAGDDVAAESQFWQALEQALNCSIDLRPYQGAVAWAVDTYGECVYEREISNSGTKHST